MAKLNVDLLVVGWGKAGKTLAAKLGKAGKKVAMVERDPNMIGGTCINVACVPTKTLIHSASRRRAVDDPDTYLADSIERRNKLISKLNSVNKSMLDTLDTVTIVVGEAQFTGSHSVTVSEGDDRIEIEAENVVINTGTKPRPIDIPGADLPHVYDSTSIQQVSPLPKKLAVIGAGPIGLEFADMFANFGSKVTLIGPKPPLASEDEDVRTSVTSVFESKGVAFVEGNATRITSEGVQLEDKTVPADAVLVAIGRAPVVPEGLESAGIEVTDRGFIQVDDKLRTSQERVWAVGDINGGMQFTYISFDDHRIVLDQLTGTGSRSRADRVAVATTTFTTPPLARVGLSEDQAREQGAQIKVAVKPVAKIAAMPRPKTIGQTDGLWKFVVDAETDEILGAAIHGVDAQEIINLIALAMRHKITASELRDSVWTHPSSTEALNEVLAELT